MKEKSKSLWTGDVKLILIACLLYMASLQMVSPILAGYTGTLGGNGTIMGIICSLLYFASLVCRPIVGYLADNISKFKLAVFGLVLMFVGPLGYALANNYVVVVIARIINGIGYATTSLALTTWISLLMPKDRIGAGMGMFGMMNAIAIAFSPYIGINVYEKFGYKTSFLIAFACALVSTILVLFVKNKGEVNEDVIENAKADEPKVKTRKPFKIIYPKIIYISIIMLLFSIPQYAQQSFALKYVEKVGLTGLVNVSLYFPVYAAALFMLRTFLKDSFDKVAFKIFLFVGCASTVASLACFTFMKNNVLLLVGAVFMSGSFGLMNSVCQAQSLVQAGAGRRGLANSTFYLGLDTGFAFGSTIAGIIYDKAPIKLFYPLICLIVPLALITYISHVLVVKAKAKKAQEVK